MALQSLTVHRQEISSDFSFLSLRKVNPSYTYELFPQFVSDQGISMFVL